MTIAQNNFPVTFSVLSANALEDCVLSFYDIGPITACKLYYMGLNDTYVVLFTFAPGQRLQRPPTPQQYYLYGSLQGRMHNAWDDFTSQHTRFKLDLAHLIDTPLESILTNVAERPGERTYIQDLAQKLRERVHNLASAGLDYGICHGDLGGGNAHIDEHQTVTFFDFDNGGQGWRSYDLAGFDWATKWYDLDEEIWQAFLQGYREHRQLHEIDLQAIPVFTTVRHFYTLGLQACHAENTGVAFIDSQYLDRHLKFLKVCTAFWG